MERTSKEHVKPVHRKWFGVACCPPNIARTLASMGQYIYSAGDNSVYVNLFISNKTEVELESGKVEISMETKFPLENTVKIKVKNVPGIGMKLAVRRPSYAKDYAVKAKGAYADYSNEKGYAVLDIREDTEAEISFEAMAKLMRANPNVRADCGKVAIVKGPLVYCLEEKDNGKNLSELFIPADQVIEETQTSLFGGITELSLKGYRMKEDEWSEEELYGEHPVVLTETKLKAVPYAYWNNRGVGEMTVWVKECVTGVK